jgi:uncharacterized linocin/CFP29 family protein
MFRSGKITLSEDLVDITVPSLDIPALARGFRIPRRSLEASRTYGTPLDVAVAKSASYQVALLEDTLVLKGSGGILGLYDGATNTEAGSTWAYHATNHTEANILIDIKDAMEELATDNIFPPFNLVLNPAQYLQTYVLVAGTAVFYRDLARDLIGGEIFQSPAIAAGTAMLLAPPDAGFFDLPLGIDIHAEVEELPLNEFKDLYGVVWEAITPRIRDGNAICTITGIA